MFNFLKGKGRQFQYPKGEPSYVGPMKDQPFPDNPLFRSQSVLSDEMRDTIWTRVVEQGEALKVVSADMNVDVRRVAAVVRLKEVEKQWRKAGKQFATPYAEAVSRMVPQAYWYSGEDNVPFENINEIVVHSATTKQLFWPVSESRQFTRADAAKTFGHTLLPADARSPQPQLITLEREVLGGATRKSSREKFVEAAQQEEKDLEAAAQARRHAEEAKTVRVARGRFEWRFKKISVQDVGADGKNHAGTGMRYGAPFDDRSGGKVKIPTEVA
ncbi:hypothetical protein CDD81_4822 [Ophiocordyceps australis]|uniref:37S ribosomal protein S35, mitochondrial n=1 Tax=Ophiocordyceps australis TaxID=1399860 RepID=A0A2C5XIU2_9HYPO|nr:hypothetical protein CDD81_4822 [Ophiocordyceps australis]